MWIPTNKLLWAAVFLGVVAFMFGRNQGSEERARLRDALVRAQTGLNQARREVESLEAARSQLLLSQRASEAGRVEAERRVQQVERDLQLARQRVVATEAEMARLVEVATKQGVEFKPTA